LPPGSMDLMPEPMMLPEVSARSRHTLLEFFDVKSIQRRDFLRIHVSCR